MPSETVSTEMASTGPNVVFEGNGVSWRCPYLVIVGVELGKTDIVLRALINDRDTGNLCHQNFIMNLPFIYTQCEDPTPEQTREVIKQAYLMLVCHELDELLRVDDSWQDPHSEESSVLDEQQRSDAVSGL